MVDDTNKESIKTNFLYNFIQLSQIKVTNTLIFCTTCGYIIKQKKLLYIYNEFHGIPEEVTAVINLKNYKNY